MASTLEYDQAASEMRRPSQHSEGNWDAGELIRHAVLAASSHNTQPWKFRVEKHLITILPDFSRRCPVVDPDDSHLFKSLGCAAENLVHAAAAQGLSAEVQFSPDENGINVFLTKDEKVHATEIFHAIPKRQCVKTAYDGNPLGGSELKQLEAAGKGSSVHAILLTSDAQKNTVIDYVTRGNIAQLSDRAFRRELVSWIRFNLAEAMGKKDGLAGRIGGQPELPTWLAKLIVGLVLTSKGQAEADATKIRSSAGVAVFVSSRDDKAAWVEVGRAYQRFALQATALDIRTAFINQPIEVRELRSQLESWLKLEGEHAQLMVRFGHGPTAPFSLRRPIDDVIIKD